MHINVKKSWLFDNNIKVTSEVIYIIIYKIWKGMIVMRHLKRVFDYKEIEYHYGIQDNGCDGYKDTSNNVIIYEGGQLFKELEEVRDSHKVMDKFISKRD